MGRRAKTTSPRNTVNKRVGADGCRIFLAFLVGTLLEHIYRPTRSNLSKPMQKLSEKEPAYAVNNRIGWFLVCSSAEYNSRAYK